MRLILASASPRRAELLTSAGYAFEIIPADVDERPRGGETARDYTLRVAREKVRAIARTVADKDAVLLGADTEVFADGRILGKPSDHTDASRMLRMLSGSVHQVMTAVVVCANDDERSDVVTTDVHVLRMSDADIEWYVSTGEPMGKAGAYAIQGRGARFIDRIHGSWSNVVGLPIHAVHRLLG